MPSSTGYLEEWPPLEHRSRVVRDENAPQNVPAPRGGPTPQTRERVGNQEPAPPQQRRQQGPPMLKEKLQQPRRQSEQLNQQVPILRNLAAAPPPRPLRATQRAQGPGMTSLPRPAQEQEQVQEIRIHSSGPIPANSPAQSPSNVRQADALPVWPAPLNISSDQYLPPSRTTRAGIDTPAPSAFPPTVGPTFTTPTGPDLGPSPGPALHIVNSSQNVASPPPTSPSLTRGISPTNAGPRAPIVRRPIDLPLLRNDEWKKYPEVDVRIGPAFAKHVTIKHIYISVKDFGDVDMITLDADTSGQRQGSARVRFRKVFQPFWEKMTLDVGSGPVQVRLERPRGAVVVQSRVNPSKCYPSKLVDTFSVLCCWQVVSS